MGSKKNNLKRETIRTDVLILGSGAAGLRAAIACAAEDVDCVLVSKGKIAAGGGSFSPYNRPWGIQAALALADPSDSPEKHFQEIMDVSLGMCDVELASILVNEAPARVRELEDYGVRFKRTEGRYTQIIGCFCNTPRALVVEDVAGAGRALKKQINTPRVQPINGLTILRLLTEGGRCVGAVGYAGDGTLLTILAGATILATGGGGAIFRYNLMGPDVTGDGNVLGYDAGAELVNLEFIQIMLGIPGVERPAFFPLPLLSRAPRFLNSQGEQFLAERFGPNGDARRVLEWRMRHYPFSCRDDSGILDVGIAKEILRGKCTRQFAIRVEGDGIEAQFPDGLQVAPFAHTFNGGLKIDGGCATTVEGLYAAGEAAGGVHGADRPGGNMLAAAFVFGARAGTNAARAAKDKASETTGEHPLPPGLAEQVERTAAQIAAAQSKDSVDVAEIRRRVRWVLWKKGLVIRNAGALSSALGSLQEQQERLDALVKEETSEGDPVAQTREVLDLEGIIRLGGLVLTAARNRCESRGAHYREDFPMKDDEQFGRPLPFSKASLEAEAQNP